VSTAAGRGFENKRERYLEAHHVISLAENGDDSVDNVIALCPEHHREAHFVANGEALEADFLKVISSRRDRL
jgi:5-methylcytosine-specific restriction enzyme A